MDSPTDRPLSRVSGGEGGHAKKKQLRLSAKNRIFVVGMGKQPLRIGVSIIESTRKIMSATSTAWKWTKRVLKWTFYTLLVFIVLAIAIPYFFKDQILEQVKKEMNKRLNATVDFGEVGLSLIWTFPDFNLSIDNITVTGKEEFAGLKLVDIGKLHVGLNLWSVFSGDYEITGLTLDKPNFFVKVLKNGKANYDIVKPDTAAVSPADTATVSSEPSKFHLALRYYAINEANITYDDGQGGTFLEIKNLTHTGSGNFGMERYDIYTKTKIDAMTFAQSGVKYLTRTRIGIDFTADIDATKGMNIKLRDNSFKFNELGLALEGEIDMPKDKDDIYLDLTFKTADTKFSSVLSMIPAAYTKDFADVKTSGSFNLAGNVKGIYNDKQIPAFALQLGIDKAQFQYPSLPMAVNDINADIKVASPSADLDKLTVDVSQFRFQLGANPFSAMFKLRTPMSDPDIDSRMQGKIDLADLSKAFPLEDATLSGIINADLEARTRVSYLTTEQYDKVQMRGLLGIAGMNYSAKGSYPIKINALNMNFTPNNVDLQQCDLNLGKSDLKMSGRVDNLLTYFAGDKIMKGNLTVTSNLLDLNELSGADATSSTTSSSGSVPATEMKDTTVAPSSDAPVFDKFDFASNVQINRIVYDVYNIQNFKLAGQVSPHTAQLSNFEMLVDKVDLKANGKLENVFGYLFSGQLLKGNFVLQSNYLNLNQFMRTDGAATEPVATTTPPPADPSTAPAEYEAVAVPNNLDFRFTANAGTLIYDTYKLKNVKCDILVKEQKVKILDLSSNFLGGFVGLSGEYNTQNIAKPAFTFAYKMAKIDFQETARTLTFIKYFLPIMQSVQGKLDLDFSLSGLLDKNMYPDLKSINSEGLMNTYEAALKGLAPLRAIGEKLRLKELETLVVKNTKNFFSIKDGRFTIKPFTTQVQGIDMLLSGSHGLDGTLDYELDLNVPRALLEKNPLGAAANNGIQLLQGEANKMGLNLQQSEVVKVAVDILGTTTKPEYKVRLVGTGKKGESLADAAKARLEEELNKAKADAEALARAKADSLKNELEKVKNNAEARARLEAEAAAARVKAQADSLKNAKEAEARAAAARVKAQADSLKNAKEAEAKAKAKAEAERLRKEAEQKAKDKFKIPKI